MKELKASVCNRFNLVFTVIHNFKLLKEIIIQMPALIGGYFFFYPQARRPLKSFLRRFIYTGICLPLFDIKIDLNRVFGQNKAIH